MDKEEFHSVKIDDTWKREWEWAWKYRVDSAPGFFLRYDIWVTSDFLSYGWGEGAAPFSAITLNGAHRKGQRILRKLRKKQERQRRIQTIIGDRKMANTTNKKEE